MDARAAEALEGSIAKWRAIAEGTGVDNACLNCPLCNMFLMNPDKLYCGGCPVMLRTGRSGCSATPYELAWNPAVELVEKQCEEELPLNDRGGYDLGRFPALRDAALLELAFLEGLRESCDGGS